MSEQKKQVRHNPVEVVHAVFTMFVNGYVNEQVAKMNFNKAGFTSYGKDFQEKYLKKYPDMTAEDFTKVLSFLESVGIKEAEGKTKVQKVKQSGGENLGLLSAEKMDEIAVDAANRDEYVLLIHSIKAQIKTLQGICKKGRVSFAIPVIKPKATDEAEVAGNPEVPAE